MSLDMGKTILQIEDLADYLSQRSLDRQSRIYNIIQIVKEADPARIKSISDSDYRKPFLSAGITAGIREAYDPDRAPRDFSVISVDGSHIDVDRHIPVRCFLINLGSCYIRYGSAPNAYLRNQPALSKEEELHISNTTSESVETVAVQGPILGLKRMVAEIEHLTYLAEHNTDDGPLLALIDGSLILWSLAGRGYPTFVRETIVQGQLIPAMERLRKVSQTRQLVVAAYISLPQSTEVINAIKRYVCTYNSSDCLAQCSGHKSIKEPCNKFNGILDRDVFGKLLSIGQRSSVFYTQSSISRDYYGDHQIYFYYINTGFEIARIEVPGWVGSDGKAVSLSHSLIVDQLNRGTGYPVSLSEAHEQAVITGGDRQSFRRMLEQSLERQNLDVYTSEKDRSKRLRNL